jgi:hypothetical protein
VRATDSTVGRAGTNWVLGVARRYAVPLTSAVADQMISSRVQSLPMGRSYFRVYGVGVARSERLGSVYHELGYHGQ